MIKLTRKIWIGIGAAAIAGTSIAIPAAAQHGQHQGVAPKATPAKEKEPGAAATTSQQGGEAYLTEGRPKDSRIFYYRSIALMRGHLLVGDELIARDRWDDALPHFLHPTEELYDQIAPYMKGQGIAPFDAPLKALAQTVKAKKKEAYERARDIVLARLDRALDGARRFMKPMRTFTLKTVVEVLKVAQSEYESSIDDGKITMPVEYQDSRGFVWYAQDMFERVARQLPKSKAGEVEGIRKEFAELKTAWPEPIPPETPILTVQVVSDHVARIEQLAAKLQ